MSTKAVKESRPSYLAEAANELIATASDSSFDAATFFEKFELLATTPSSIAMLRALLLQLAFQGKLAESRREDLRDWDSVCGKLALHEESEYEDLKFGIPGHWCWTSLDKIGDIKPRNKIEDGLEVGFAPMTTIPISFRDDVAFEKRAWSEIKKGFTHFQENDVVLAKITPCFQNGKSAVIRGCPNGVGAGTTELHVCRPNLDIVQPEFILLYAKSPWFLKRGIPLMTGSAGQKRVPRSYFAKSPFPLPPLAEQERIVAKVDELMGLCDRLEALEAERKERHASLSRAALARFADSPTPINLQFLFHNSFDVEPSELRKSILTLAVQGKLVPQDHADEDAEKMLLRLEAKGGNPKVRRGVPVDVKRPVTLDDRSLPDSWVIESIARLLQLGAILDLKDGNHGANHPKVAEFTRTGLPFITAAQVSDRGDIDYDGAYKVSGVPLQRLRVGFALPNDVIYTHKGSVGRVAICDRECVLTPQTTYYRVNGDVLSSGFTQTVLRSPFFRDQVDLVKRQTTRDFVSINAQYQFFVRVPPISEQKRIVAKVDELMTLVDQLEQQLAHSRTLGQKLLEAVASKLTQNGESPNV